MQDKEIGDWHDRHRAQVVATVLGLRIEVQPAAAASQNGRPGGTGAAEAGTGVGTGTHTDSDRDIGDNAGNSTDTDTDTDLVFRAVLQLRSTVDPSLVVDAADLWSAPTSVLTRFGEQAETDMLLALRRGAAAWPPLGAALRAASPSTLDLGDEAVVDLLGPAAEALGGAGVEVLWPAELVTGGLRLQAEATPSPGAVAAAGFSMKSLLSFRWQVALDGEPLTDAEVNALAEAKRPLVRLRGRWDGLFLRATPAARKRNLELRVDGDGSGVLYVGERSFWSPSVRWTTYPMSGRVRVRHPYSYPTSGGSDLLVTLGRAAGSADLDSVALVPRGEPEGKVFKLGPESPTP